jgi:hypothetical protein
MRALRSWALVAVLGTAACTEAQQPPLQWCAQARSPEPLLADGVRLGTAQDPETVSRRQSIGMAAVPRDSVVLVRDEATCRRAAQAYWTILRTSVSDLFGNHADTPVLVVAVGSVYLVDDLRNRQTYWEVMVFNQQWQRRYGFGGGA